MRVPCMHALHPHREQAWHAAPPPANRSNRTVNPLHPRMPLPAPCPPCCSSLPSSAPTPSPPPQKRGLECRECLEKAELVAALSEGAGSGGSTADACIICCEDYAAGACFFIPSCILPSTCGLPLRARAWEVGRCPTCARATCRLAPLPTPAPPAQTTCCACCAAATASTCPASTAGCCRVPTTAARRPAPAATRSSRSARSVHAAERGGAAFPWLCIGYDFSACR